ncbi:MAG: hypothetical protein LW832_06380 [Parachlamydia sp.]|jgi:hypothetical protein|nr:hypothetical protein [Parachlamydia sp.]
MSKIASIEDIIKKTEERIKQLGISPKKEKYKHLILQEAEKYSLTENQVKKLGQHIGIKWIAPPYFAIAWKPSLCKIYMSVKYTNPNNPQEFIVIISSKSLFGIKSILHHTPNGYLDKSWLAVFRYSTSYQPTALTSPFSKSSDSLFELPWIFFFGVPGIHTFMTRDSNKFS